MIFNLFVIKVLEFFSFAKGQSDSSEITSQGRMKYQLLRERGNLPKYGPCWKAALDTVDDGCRELSEETQSDIALSLANCFLEMSGLEQYYCDSDKKQNVRQICISSMTDRAFNVYTEFYTHTLHICWFLRGQIWQETISENTFKVGKQLENSAVKQEKLLEIQKESLEIQGYMLEHGKIIENVLAELSLTTQSHQEMLVVMGNTINNLQSWLVGEVSWFNTLMFHIGSGFFVIILTSTPFTIISRLPLLTILIINIFAERFICNIILSNGYYRSCAKELYGDIYECIQLSRYFFIIVCLGILTYNAYFHEDILLANKTVLGNIRKQNELILKKLELHSKNITLPNETYLLHKTNSMQFVEKTNQSNHCDKESLKECESSTNNLSVNTANGYFLRSISPTLKIVPRKGKYNLRSRQNTPEFE